MLKKKILLCAVFTALVCMTSCKKDTELIDDFTTTTTAISQTSAESAEEQAVTTAEKSDGFPNLVLDPEVSDEEENKAAAEEEAAEKYFEEHGFTLHPGSQRLYIDMNNFPDVDDPLAGLDKKYSKYLSCAYISNGAGRDLSFIANTKEIEDLIFEDDIGDADLSFLTDCENVSYLWLQNKSINAEKLAETVKNSHLEKLLIDIEEYSSEDADIIMRAAPSCEVDYRMKYVYTELPAEELRLYTNNIVSASAENPQKWDAKTDGEFGYPQSWGYKGSLVSTFTNLTKETQNLTSVRIFRESNGVVTEMPFADGSTSLDIDITINSGEKTDFDISEDMFPFSACETGIYSIEFDCGGERLLQQFTIDNNGVYNETVEADADIWDRYLNGARMADDGTYSIDVPAFLDGEQREAFKSAFVITSLCFGSSGYLPQEFFDKHTEEEFFADYCKGYTYDYAYSKLKYYNFIDENGKLRAGSWDGGSDPSHFGDVFIPLYSDENEVLFKSIIIHSHDLSPSQVQFEEVNFHMIKTEDGWKFDSFRYLG